MDESLPNATEVAPEKEGLLKRILEELGLVSMYASSRDVKLLCLQRFVRMFAYGISTLILVAYLDALEIRKTEIGLFMTLTLVGDTCLSFFLTLFADALGRRAILAFGAILMSASGVVFALFGTYWVLLIAAVIGVISPSGNEIGPFRAIEESIVAQLTDPKKRSDVYAWYSLLGLVGTACGCMVCGWILQYLTGTLQWDFIRSYRAIYVGYAILGLVKLTLTVLLSYSVESEKKQLQRRQRDDETRPLLESNAESTPAPKRGLRYLLPDVSKESVPVVITLCLLFALDSFGSGLAPLSWITYYFKYQFNIEEGKLGSIFFVTQILAGASMIVASSLAKRFGNVNTMVFTHLPSQVFRALIGIPSDLHLALVFLVLNSSTQSMDSGPRSAFLATIVLPRERTAVMGTVNVVKTTAQSLGPILTGFLVDRNLFWVSFVASGCLKIAYDIGLLAFFKEKERERERAERLRIQGDDE
ncbi:MFS general substrate transporter [Annulohypoxylon maeteangense]|uniref:MFS general substrate transporter n=1 Tax=Annulohypoxylon maeteangense TaxID=1927788 RepID=UPI0020087901|nr:MFS general substrate transporter [Annulohypoxylon maeteangense]KAI0888023.1 MFS general substrate transporter [Annulohypoxylon maeteangense]